MNESETALAFLVPRLTGRVEDAATDVLGHILNHSKECRDSLQRMLERETGFDLATLASVATQVTYEDGTRPDMDGYDREGVKRLLVESKFWAALRAAQPRFVDQFDHCYSAVLLFIAPAARIETLWAEIIRQFDEEGLKLEQRNSSPESRSARLPDTESGAARGVVLTSWRRLLDELAAAAGETGATASDIAQLRGLSRRQDDAAFLPVHAEDLGPEFGRRLAGYCQLVDDLIGRGMGKRWISTKNLKVTPQRWGYGRYFSFVDRSGWGSDSLWLGINHDRWARTADTPLWLRCEWSQAKASAATIADRLGVVYSGRWIPVHLLKGVEYQAVLDDAECTLQRIARIMGADLPDK